VTRASLTSFLMYWAMSYTSIISLSHKDSPAGGCGESGPTFSMVNCSMAVCATGMSVFQSAAYGRGELTNVNGFLLHLLALLGALATRRKEKEWLCYTMSADLIWATHDVSSCSGKRVGINKRALPSCLCVSDLSLAMVSVEMYHVGIGGLAIFQMQV
jgi:hypothetical protein